MVAQAFHAGLLAAVQDVVGFDARSAATVVGTSAGAATAALLRAGLGGADLVRRACGKPADARVAPILERLGPPLDLSALRARRQRRVGRPPSSTRRLRLAALRPWEAPGGTVSAALVPEGDIPWTMVAEPVDRLFPDGWPAEPMWVCTVRLDDGARVVFGRPGEMHPPASVGMAVAASCAIPGFYKPVEVSGSRYVAGGAWSATDADVVASEGFDVVVISSPLTVRTGPWNRHAPMRAVLIRQLRHEVATLCRSGSLVVVAEPTAEDADVMGADMLYPSRREPVARHVLASATARLRGAIFGRSSWPPGSREGANLVT